jgi:hypothetical protein
VGKVLLISRNILDFESWVGPPLQFFLFVENLCPPPSPPPFYDGGTLGGGGGGGG